ncbi:hypothetical protein SDC9_123456 [bioreactor metagenome]|uniref:Uncharacterized protein n=1 Tax=bioreactor metagenome TaxID=1076179 RepID=A0A645CHT2_9ZZZZ
MLHLFVLIIDEALMVTGHKLHTKMIGLCIGSDLYAFIQAVKGCQSSLVQVAVGTQLHQLQMFGRKIIAIVGFLQYGKYFIHFHYQTPHFIGRICQSENKESRMVKSSVRLICSIPAGVHASIHSA